MTTSFNLSQVANYLNSSGQLNLATGVYGTLPQTNGGTGATSLASVAVTSLVAGTGISLSASVGTVTITNTGGSGGSTVTTSATDVTLTNSSNRVQQIVMTAANKLVKLPDATTMTTLGGPIFIIANNGGYAFNIATSDGYVICPVPSGATVTMSLASSSSATAGWICSSTGPNGLAQYLSSFSGVNFGNAATRTSTSVNKGTISVCALSSTAIFITYINPTNLDAYGMVCTISGGVVSYGTPAIILVSSVDVVKCVALSSTGVMVITGNTTPTTSFYGIVVSGTSFTVSPVLNFSTYYRVIDAIKLDSTRVLVAYSRAVATTGNYLEVIVYNGASAPTAPGGSVSVGGYFGTLSGDYKAVSLTLVDTDKVAIFYNTSTLSPPSLEARLNARIATISLYTITLGTALPLTLNSGLALYTIVNLQSFTYSTTEAACIAVAYYPFNGQATTGGVTANANTLVPIGNSNVDNQIPVSISISISGTAVTQGNVLELKAPFANAGIGQGYTFVPRVLTSIGNGAQMDTTNMLIGDINTQGVYRLKYIPTYGFVVGSYVCTTNAPLGFGVASLSSTQAVLVGSGVTNWGQADSSEISCAVVQIPA